MDTYPSRVLLKVFLVEDAGPVRQRIAQRLAAIAGVVIVGEAEDNDSALEAIGRLRTDVAVIDLRLAAGSSLPLIVALRAGYPEIVTIVVTNHSDPAFESASRSAGADFFFDKTADFEAVHRTIAALVPPGFR